MVTTYEYEIQGDYGHGWEHLTTEATLADAKIQRRCYDDNEPGIPHRIKKVPTEK